MSRLPREHGNGILTAAVHLAGGRWHAVIGTATDGGLDVKACRTLAERSELESWLAAEGAEHVVHILSATDVASRTCALPRASANDLEEALALQAEAHVSVVAPPHRVARAILPAAPGETGRCGLLLAWPEGRHPGRLTFDGPLTYSSEVGALAGLLGSQRPAEPLLWVDRATGSVAIAFSHADGATFRGTLEDLADPGWQGDVKRVLAETALHVGHTGDYVDRIVDAEGSALDGVTEGGCRLVLPEALRADLAERVTGAGDDAAWWAENGLAIGALLARASSMYALTEIVDALPAERPSPGRRIAESLSRPHVATLTAIVAMAALFISPLLFSGLRLLLVRARYPEERLASLSEEADDLQAMRELYDELGRQAWPMTKLLSDIAASTPIGIDLEMISISNGEPFTISGRATPHEGLAAQELVALMQENLKNSRIFTDVKLNWGEGQGFSGTYEFDLSATVSRPQHFADYALEMDFARWTYEDRINDVPAPGDEADLLASAAEEPDDPAAPPGAPDDDIDPTDPGATPVLVTDGDGDEEGGDEPGDGADDDPVRMAAANGESEGRSPGRGPGRFRDLTGGDSDLRRNSDNPDLVVPASQDIPEPVTTEQIGQMGEAEARALLTRVAHARKYATDPEVQDRLRREFTELMTHIRSFSESG